MASKSISKPKIIASSSTSKVKTITSGSKSKKGSKSSVNSYYSTLTSKSHRNSIQKIIRRIIMEGEENEGEPGLAVFQKSISSSSSYRTTRTTIGSTITEESSNEKANKNCFCAPRKYRQKCVIEETTHVCDNICEQQLCYQPTNCYNRSQRAEECLQTARKNLTRIGFIGQDQCKDNCVVPSESENCASEVECMEVFGSCNTACPFECGGMECPCCFCQYMTCCLSPYCWCCGESMDDENDDTECCMCGGNSDDSVCCCIEETVTEKRNKKDVQRHKLCLPVCPEIRTDCESPCSSNSCSFREWKKKMDRYCLERQRCQSPCPSRSCSSNESNSSCSCRKTKRCKAKCKKQCRHRRKCPPSPCPSRSCSSSAINCHCKKSKKCKKKKKCKSSSTSSCHSETNSNDHIPRSKRYKKKEKDCNSTSSCPNESSDDEDCCKRRNNPCRKKKQKKKCGCSCSTLSSSVSCSKMKKCKKPEVCNQKVYFCAEEPMCFPGQTKITILGPNGDKFISEPPTLCQPSCPCPEPQILCRPCCPTLQPPTLFQLQPSCPTPQPPSLGQPSCPTPQPPSLCQPSCPAPKPQKITFRVNLPRETVCPYNPCMPVVAQTRCFL